MVKNLSLGEKRRLEIAMAVLTEPKVLLLDEPLAGLSESEIKGVLDVLRQRIGRQTILIVEHKISHVQDFLQRLTVMHEGRIIADGGLRGNAERPGSAPELLADRHHRRTGQDRRGMTNNDDILTVAGLNVAYGELKALFDVGMNVRRTRSSPASAATAPARARCSRASPDFSSRRRERSSPTARAWSA